jgi:hypothetical protein
MNNATRIARLVAGLMLIGVPTVAAQTPPPSKKIYVDFNFGVQPSAQTFSITTPNPPQIVYGESVILSGTQGINGSTLIDIMGGYRVWKNFSVALGFDTTIGGKGDASVTAGIPHPIFFDTRKESTQEVTDLKHSEQAIHLAFMWTTPLSDKMDASVYAGPSWIKVKQDVINSVNVPPGTQDFTAIVTEESEGAKTGFHFGGDVTYLFMPNVGAGGFLRFVNASVDLPSAPGLDAGGFQYGGGVRVRF